MMNSRNTAPETSSSVFKRTTSKSVGDDADGDKFDGLAVIKEFNKWRWKEEDKKYWKKELYFVFKLC